MLDKGPKRCFISQVPFFCKANLFHIKLKKWEVVLSDLIATLDTADCSVQLSPQGH